MPGWNSAVYGRTNRRQRDGILGVLVGDIKELLRELIKPSGDGLVIYDSFRTPDLTRDNVRETML